MTLSFGQSLLKLPEDSASGAAFSLEKPQQAPKTDDFLLSRSVHFGSLRAIDRVLAPLALCDPERDQSHSAKGTRPGGRKKTA
jgi:hypothetical protein